MTFFGLDGDEPARVGDPVRARVRPVDAHGNPQDYRVFPKDDLRVVAKINNLRDLEFQLTAIQDTTTDPPSTYFDAVFVPTEAGRYEFTVDFDANAGDGSRVASSSGTTRADVLPGTASPFHSVVSGTGARFAKTFTPSFFRVELRDAHGNYAGDGAYVSPRDAAALPDHRATHVVDGEVVPVILEARLVRRGENWTLSDVSRTWRGTTNRACTWGRTRRRERDDTNWWCSCTASRFFSGWITSGRRS